jgi:MFS superfamily sulfate permease-like transporter
VAVFVFLDGRFVLSDDFFKSYTAQELNLLKISLSVLAVSVLVLSVAISVWFSWRKSVKKGLRIWTSVSRRLLTNLIVPLVTGGILIIILYFHQQWQLVLPSMLIFYGLALVSATKFTYNEIFYLGVIEIVSGLLAAALPSYGIILWSFGFGFLHIVYGLMMYRKYER